MTRSRNPPASRPDSRQLTVEEFDDATLDETSQQAWTEAMTVRPFGDAYLVDCAGSTHYVSLDPSDCSCPASDDHRCVHVRRVAIEINLGRVPPPSGRAVECAGCDRQVAVSAAESPPYLCPDCHLEPGDLVVDAEGDEETPLLVVSSPGRPADLVSIPDDDRTVFEYHGNGQYPSDAPVVEAVYPQTVSIDSPPRRYLFPLTRLRKPDLSDGRPPELGADAPGDPPDRPSE